MFAMEDLDEQILRFPDEMILNKVKIESLMLRKDDLSF